MKRHRWEHPTDDTDPRARRCSVCGLRATYDDQSMFHLPTSECPVTSPLEMQEQL